MFILMIWIVIEYFYSKNGLLKVTGIQIYLEYSVYINSIVHKDALWSKHPVQCFYPIKT